MHKRCTTIRGGVPAWVMIMWIHGKPPVSRGLLNPPLYKVIFDEGLIQELLFNEEVELTPTSSVAVNVM